MSSRTNRVITDREREILGLVGRGMTSATIATHLGIAASTVDAHVKSALRKLGARNRRHASLLAAELER